MSTLCNLPPELLARITDYTATPLPPDPKRRVSSSYAGQQIPDGPTYAGLSYSNIALATSPAPDIASLRSLRLVSKTLEQLRPEDIDFRVIVLSTFYAGLADAEKLFNLSIKSLQNITPKALMGKASTTEEIAFENNFEVVMRRITQLGLCITVEDWDAAPENTLHQPEVHDFFGLELQEYWLGPIAAQLEYLRIYGNEEAYWGFYPAGNLPHFPALRTLIL
ncbi:hypothetical protein KCU73_g11198, partial [Aureobasidium melanogenum]